MSSAVPRPAARPSPSRRLPDPRGGRSRFPRAARLVRCATFDRRGQWLRASPRRALRSRALGGATRPPGIGMRSASVRRVAVVFHRGFLDEDHEHEPVSELHRGRSSGPVHRLGSGPRPRRDGYPSRTARPWGRQRRPRDDGDHRCACRRGRSAARARAGGRDLPRARRLRRGRRGRAHARRRRRRHALPAARPAARLARPRRPVPLPPDRHARWNGRLLPGDRHARRRPGANRRGGPRDPRVVVVLRLRTTVAPRGRSDRWNPSARRSSAASGPGARAQPDSRTAHATTSVPPFTPFTVRSRSPGAPRGRREARHDPRRSWRRRARAAPGPGGGPPGPPSPPSLAGSASACPSW